MTNKLDITTIILTYNEEIHIRRCLENVCQFSKKVYVIDSPSTDRTVEICNEFENVEVVMHKYPGNQAEQFNWTIDNCRIDTEWILRVDADEYCEPELITEMEQKLQTLPKEVSAVVVPIGREFMGRRLRHGIVNGVSLTRLLRPGKVRYEASLMDEYMKVLEGESVKFDHAIVDASRIPLSAFTDKHNNYSSREAAMLLDAEYQLRDLSAELSAGGEMAKEVIAKRAKKAKYSKMPLFWRSMGYFMYRYIVKMGFLDGKEGFCWDFFQGLWYRALVDGKVFQAKKWMKVEGLVIKKDGTLTEEGKSKLKTYIKDNWKISL